MAQDLAAVQQLVCEQLAADGLGWLALHIIEVTEDGRWEKIVDLYKVTFAVPGFRPFGLLAGSWCRDFPGRSSAACDSRTWALAGEVTGHECPSWFASDAGGHEFGCFNLTHALDVADHNQPASSADHIRPELL